jgi:hypothetical protein
MMTGDDWRFRRFSRLADALRALATRRMAHARRTQHALRPGHGNGSDAVAAGIPEDRTYTGAARAG